jgi:hypothetical protein
MVPARRRNGQPTNSGWTATTVLPLLAAAYPIVFLFTINAAEQVTMDALWPPLGLAVGVAAVWLIGLAVLLRDPQRAALLTTVAVVSFFGYGHAWNAASSTLDSQWPLIGAWLLATALALAVAWRAGPWTPAVVRGLALVALIALLLNAVDLGRTVTALAAPDPLAPANGPEVELSPPDGASLPDVYYLVPDRYASAETLRERFDFDNEPFLAALEERGFAIARDAHANYTKTPLSLGSSLNLRYLDGEALAEEAVSGEDRGPAHRLLREPLVAPRALKRLGYRYLHVGGWWSPSTTNVDADRVFGYDGEDSFASALAQTTLVRAFTDPDAAPDDPYDWRVVRANTEYALDRLEEIPQLEGPKYVFGHLLLPHAPYVFDADGSFMDRAEVRAHGQRESYRRQLTYTNGRLLALVDRIIAETPGAIIVIQADEGPLPPRYEAGEGSFDWRQATQAELEEKFGIMLAMRVPGADLRGAGFHDALTPVNVFRVIFNARFGAELPLLPDRVWTHVGVMRWYDFVEITDRLGR